jgi:hypothetical protein
VLFVSFIIFDFHSFNCIKYHFFFQVHPLTFNFYIKFVLLFYDVSGLTLNVLISNLDSMLFYKILISFRFYPWIYDLNFNFFFVIDSHSLDFLFFFWILL